MFNYDRPMSAIDAAPATTRISGQAEGFRLAELVQALWRRKILIVGAGLICACAAVMVGKSLTPRYTATAQLYLDPRELQLVDRELTPRSQDSSGLSMVVESQARLMTSNNVLLRVIEDNNLLQDPEFGGPSTGLLKSLFSFSSFGSGSSATDKMAARTVALEALNRHLTVKRTDRTYVIDIDVWSTDPAKAAKLANEISKAYLQESRDSQSGAARRATSDLSSRLKELQGRLRTAENALEVYKAKNNFVGTQDTLVSDQQLLAGAQRVAAAKALTLDAQARYDQIEAGRKAATDAGAIPEALQSPTIANLRAQYAEARRRYAELTNELGPRHPSLRNTEKQVEDIKRNISEEVARYAQSAKNDLARARDYETSLSKALDAQKRQSVDLSQASVRLRELERDVEAGRNVYQSFLKRSRETEEQETLNTSSARVIGEATQPQRRTFPPAMSTIAMIGFVAGAVLAAALVIAANRLSTPAVPTPVRQPDRRPVPPDAKAAPALMPHPQTAAAGGNLDLKTILAAPPIQSVAPVPIAVPVSAPPDKTPIARFTEADVVRTLTGILAPASGPDLIKLGWPTLRAASDNAFSLAVAQMRANVVKQMLSKATPVVAVMGPCAADERSIVALNVALAAARSGARVLLVDADHARHGLSDKMVRYTSPEDNRRWLVFGAKAAAPIVTENGVSVLPARGGARQDKTLADARTSGLYDLIVLDGPAMPIGDGKVLIDADGVIAALSTSRDINVSMDEILAVLGGNERKVVGVVIDELTSPEIEQQKAKQYA